MRARNIKPGFFKNDTLAELDFAGRLLFIGLWGLADREGRLEDRPKKIKAEIFPYDDVAVDSFLGELANSSRNGSARNWRFPAVSAPHWRMPSGSMPVIRSASIWNTLC